MIPPVGTLVLFSSCTCPIRRKTRAYRVWDVPTPGFPWCRPMDAAISPVYAGLPRCGGGASCAGRRPGEPCSAGPLCPPPGEDTRTIQFIVEDGDSVLVDYRWCPGIGGHTRLLQALRAAAVSVASGNYRIYFLSDPGSETLWELSECSIGFAMRRRLLGEGCSLVLCKESRADGVLATRDEVWIQPGLGAAPGAAGLHFPDAPVTRLPRYMKRAWLCNALWCFFNILHAFFRPGAPSV